MKLYAEELMYSTAQMGTDEILNANLSAIHNNTDLIVADSAEDRLIHELRHKGLNIIGAEKGPGSIRAGITRIQDFEIVVSPKSVNLKQELMNYIWNDKKAGIPVDKHNHLIDPIRYALKQLDRPAMFIG
jgi:phage terminase large subunit